ncbi:peptidase A24 [Methylobacterium variabile]|jgi:leader peptidase (prepilin peptidase)/N-methyltransferase|uniref:Peptidase A24 n=1 Tax=Methylobacterium variabile TaxID=298794 RepID=A0A0J6SUI6_9HYPH|nr:A24 family peptidase [Methylobacterium variabile]KMO37192.1 peptidase A24 [Methylobacterium variabile]
MSAALIAGALLPLPLTLPASLIDLRHRIIPDALNLALLVLGLAVAAWHAGTWSVVGLGLTDAGLAFGLFWTLRALHARLSGRIGLGLGDVKFIAAASAWTGLAGLPVLILAASLSALAAVGLVALAGRRVARTTALPFGPFLALGLHAALLVGAAG